MAPLLWLCLAGVVLLLLSPIAPAIAAKRLFNHAKSTARSPLFGDIERFDEVSERFARASDALARLSERVQLARTSVRESIAGRRLR